MREADLEKGCVIETALGSQPVDQLLEWHVLIRVQLAIDFADSAHQLGEARIPGGVSSQDQGADKEADQLLDLLAVSPGDRNADRDISLASRAHQEGRESTDQDYEWGYAVFTAELAHLFGQLGRNVPRREVAPVLLQGRPRSVDRQFQQGWRAGQLFLPIGQLAVENVPFEVVPLPEGEVDVLNG